GGLAHARGQRGRDGDRRPPLGPAGHLSLRRLDRDLADRLLLRPRPQTGRGRVADRPGAAGGSEAAGAAPAPLRAAGGEGEAAPRGGGSIADRSGPGSLPGGAREMSEVAERPVTAGLAPARKSPLSELLQYRQLVGMLIVRELKVRYKRSVLGMLWTMLNPLLLMAVYTVVVATVMRSPLRNCAFFLLSGLLPWLCFSTAVLQGLASILTNQELIRKVRLPQAVFPLSVVGSNLVNFALSLVPLFLLMAVLGQPFTPALLFIPIGILILSVFTTGVTILFSTFTVFFPPVRHLPTFP